MRIPRPQPHERASRALLLAATLFAAPTLHAEVTLTTEERDNLGIRTEAVREVDTARTWRASAQVLDPSPLIAALSELQAAEHAAAVSRSEAERAERLYKDDTNVARKAVDSARAQAIADAGKVATARAQLMAAWGRPIGSLSADARARLADDLLNGRTSLVRAEHLSALPADAQIADANLSELIGKRTWQAKWMGALPPNSGAAGGASTAGASAPSSGAASGGTLFGASLLQVQAQTQVPAPAQVQVPEQAPVPAQGRGQGQTQVPAQGQAQGQAQGDALLPGQLLTATLSQSGGSKVRGVQVAPTAIIRWHGTEWIYEETSPNRFERHEVRSSVRHARGNGGSGNGDGDGGTSIESDLKPGQKVVIVGARALLAAEQGASEPQDAADADD